jgi:hypothetical protein
MKLKRIPLQGTLEGTLDDAQIDVVELADEMITWRDNLAGTSLENTQKYSDVDEAAAALESVASDLESIDIPERLAGHPCHWIEEIPYGRRHAPSRSQRAANISSSLQAVASELRDSKLAEDETSNEAGMAADELDDAGMAADELDDAASRLGDVSFPGMYT